MKNDVFIEFKGGIKAWGMETIEGITVVYLSMMKEDKEEFSYTTITNGKPSSDISEKDNSFKGIRKKAKQDVKNYLDKLKEQT